jgi:hypothetical protein
MAAMMDCRLLKENKQAVVESKCVTPRHSDVIVVAPVSSSHGAVHFP